MASSTSSLIISKNRNPCLLQTCCRPQPCADFTIHRDASNSVTQEDLPQPCYAAVEAQHLMRGWSKPGHAVAGALTPGSFPTRSGCRGAYARGPSCNLRSRDTHLRRSGGDMRDMGGQGFPRASLPNPACSHLGRPAAPFLHVERGEKASSHQSWVEQAEVSSQTRPDRLTTYQSRGHTGAHRGRGGAGRRGPGPRARWSFAGRRGRPAPGSASRWHPAGSPPAG